MFSDVRMRAARVSSLCVMFRRKLEKIRPNCIISEHTSKQAHNKMLLEVPTYLFFLLVLALFLHPHLRLSSKLLILRGSE